MFRSVIGHDFARETIDKELAGIRLGWPMTASEYPDGYGVANPPGFCIKGCDCMDDGRPQRLWETQKSWLEDQTRTFVRRRGTVSKQCYFETANIEQNHSPNARAAVDLASTITRTVQKVMLMVPVDVLISDEDPVMVPACAFLPDLADYEPVRFDIAPAASGALPPSWLQVGADDGRIIVSTAMERAQAAFTIEMSGADGVVGVASCAISLESSSPWLVATSSIVKVFETVQLDKGVRRAMWERMSEIYDFRSRTVLECTLCFWLTTMSLLVRMLKSSVMANVYITPRHD